MLKAVFRPHELVTLPDRIRIESPTSYPDLAHLSPVEDLDEEITEVEEYAGPTADDLRREAEMFKTRWEEEKERMITSAREQAEEIITEAQKAAFAEVKRQTDEALVIRQQAEEEAERIIADAQKKGFEIENEIRQSLEGERKSAMDEGRQLGKTEGFADGKAEVDRLLERTKAVLERAQNKRAEILNVTEKQIIDLVLLITKKVIKVISEKQRGIIVTNVIEALRKVKSKGDIIIRVNLSDLKVASEHKQEFIDLLENAKSVQVIEDSTVDPGGCIIETDFGEIDARIASQLAELENRILDISPVNTEKTPMPFLRASNLNADMLASASLMEAETKQKEMDEHDSNPFGIDGPGIGSEEDEEISRAASAALTASAALAALSTMATKGKRESDKKIKNGMEKSING